MRQSNRNTAGTLARRLARELSASEMEHVGGTFNFTLTCSDQTITDCDTDNDCD